MIPRYARPEMVAIWSPETKFRIWYEIEAHACDAQADLGVIPRENAQAVWKARDVQFDVDRIDEIEAVTKHDVIAFLTNLAEYVGEEARFVHQGMTSSDVLDTCLAVQLARASDILIADLDRLLAEDDRLAPGVAEGLPDRVLAPVVGISTDGDLEVEPLQRGGALAGAVDGCRSHDRGRTGRG